MFTAAQAQAGAGNYHQNCARCHGAFLQGSEFGPSLRGRGIIDHWAAQPLATLLARLKATMPPSQPGMLSDEAYVAIIAYLLQSYGMNPGGDPLPSQSGALSHILMPDEDTLVRTIGGTAGGLTPGAILPFWPAATNPLDSIASVTESLLSAPSPGSWPTWRRTRDAAGFSPSRQITKDNIQDLRIAWTLALPPGPNETTPLVHDGVMFVQSYGDYLQALNAATGDELWRFHPKLEPGTTPKVHRNMALYGYNLYFSTSDLRIVALNVKSGREVWEHLLGDPKLSEARGGPVVAKGVLMQGVSGDRLPGGGYVIGIDAATGNRLWKFNSIAQPGQPGGNTWNNLPIEQRTGGSIWTAGSYDADLGLAFFGPAPTYNTEPLRVPSRRPGVSNDALYTDTTVALDPLTGRLVWHYQHLPNDQWDLDWAFERHVFDMSINGRVRKLIATAGKSEIYDVLDARRGTYMFSLDLGIQNIVSSIDHTSGRKSVNARLIPGNGEKVIVCPHASGGKNWLPAAYSPDAHVLYVAAVESCMEILPMAKGLGLLTSGAELTLRPPPNSDGKYGRLQAINLETRQTIWTHRQRAPIVSGILVTAGGLVFSGSVDRWFTGQDADTGKVLWRVRLTDVPNTAPISFEVSEKQYIAIVVGGGYGVAAAFPPLVPETHLPVAPSSAVWVFELSTR
jgi:alcohol dehydrogenase (cytochrome c)